MGFIHFDNGHQEKGHGSVLNKADIEDNSTLKWSKLPTVFFLTTLPQNTENPVESELFTVKNVRSFIALSVWHFVKSTGRSHWGQHIPWTLLGYWSAVHPLFVSARQCTLESGGASSLQGQDKGFSDICTIFGVIHLHWQTQYNSHKSVSFYSFLSHQVVFSC